MATPPEERGAGSGLEGDDRVLSSEPLMMLALVRALEAWVLLLLVSLLLSYPLPYPLVVSVLVGFGRFFRCIIFVFDSLKISLYVCILLFLPSTRVGGEGRREGDE